MLLRLGWVWFLVLLGTPVLGQRISVEFGEARIPIDQYFTITVRAEGGDIKTVDGFPEITGFKKSTRFATTTTTTVAGVATVSRSVTQRYAALEEGSYELKPFIMRVNSQTVSAKGTTITVLPMGTDPDNLPAEPEEERVTAQHGQDYGSLEEDAFLSVSASKKEAYVGEGVQATLWFYLAVSDQHLLEFHDFANQIPVLIRQLRQKSAWEESIDLVGEVVPEQVRVENKDYLRYRLHSAVYYPLNSDPLVFPSLSIRMKKYNLPPGATFASASENRQSVVKTYISRVKTVVVRELPPHPLRHSVPVGEYRLREEVSASSVKSGKSLDYSFRVEGEGNLAAVQAPVAPPDAPLEIYPPEVTQQIDRLRAGISGSKAFRYHLLPRQPGQYDLGNFFSLIYFNPALGQYDTLRSQLVVQVTGQEDTDAAIQSRDLGAFYNLIYTEDNTLVSLHQFEEVKRHTNLVVLVLLVVVLALYFKK